MIYTYQLFWSWSSRWWPQLAWTLWGQFESKLNCNFYIKANPFRTVKAMSFWMRFLLFLFFFSCEVLKKSTLCCTVMQPCSHLNSKQFILHPRRNSEKHSPPFMIKHNRIKTRIETEVILPDENNVCEMNKNLATVLKLCCFPGKHVT